MNKSVLKKFATSIRLDLIGLVKTKVDYFLKLDISNLPIEYKKNESSVKEIINRCTVDDNVDKSKYEDFIEEVAYTWFNRFVALRFMDVNDITEVKVVSPINGYTIPQIFSEAKSGNISEDLNFDKNHFYNVLDKKIDSKDSDNECYRILFISTCNYYSSIMPFMFESISDYTELLLPDDLLSTSSVRTKVIEGMSEEDCSDVEVIGWLYQFYISEKKDEVFEKLKKNVKITPSNIPAATQLFTPHWIVKYMVENSLGKLWMLNHPNSPLKDSMKYYIEEENPTDTFLKISTPQELTLIDICCGSGHILTYSFDLLTLIYEEEGYSKSEIPTLILENNLFGCDIDKRAATLANFALTMKARLYHKRFFKKSVNPNIVELQEFGTQEFKGIKNFGSLLAPKNIQSFDDGIFSQNNTQYDLQLKILTSTYSCVVTNPPYMGGKGMNAELGDFVKNKYPDSKSDLFAVFMERTLELTKQNGFMSMINQPSWLFLSSFEKLRIKLLEHFKIDSLLHMGRGIFGIDWGSTAFVINKSQKLEDIGNYFRLHKRNFQHLYYYDIEKLFLNSLKNKKYKYDFDTYRDDEEGIRKISNESHSEGSIIYFKSKQSDFKKIPSSPIAYWVSSNFAKKFDATKTSDVADTRLGMATADNDKFLRVWNEISIEKMSNSCLSRVDAKKSFSKWFPYQKGGEFRKWYGNYEYVVNWENDGFEIQNFINSDTGKVRSHNYNLDYIFKKGITWNALSSGNTSMRVSKYSLFDNAGSSMFLKNENDFLYCLSLYNSHITPIAIKAVSPTLNYQPGDISKIPVSFPKQESIKQTIDKLTQQCIDISREEWDSRETSWDFTKNEILRHKSDSKIETSYNNYCSYWKEKFYQLHSNEEELNRLFIDIYELQDELTPDVDLKDITILKQESFINNNNELEFNSDEVMKQFISYAVGIMFGRYSLDQEGLVVANLNQDYPKDTTFEIDDDNVIPVLEDDYFSDDIASRIINFVKTTFGSESLSENIYFIEKCLGKSIRNYMVKDFYEDHIKRYKKRPIYWMVSSPKKEFMSLSYMHRYEGDLFARVQNNYLREYITKLEGTKEILNQTILNETSSNKDKKDADKRIKDIDKKLKEIYSFDRDKLTSFAQNRVEIDLDDGVKVNYTKFKEILYPIKGLEKE